MDSSRAEWASKLKMGEAQSSTELREVKKGLGDARDDVDRMASKCTRLAAELAEAGEGRRADMARCEVQQGERLAQAHALHQAELEASRRERLGADDTMRRLHEEEIEAMKRQCAEALTVGKLAAQVQDGASQIEGLQRSLAERHTASEAARTAQLEARERLVTDMQRAASQARSRAEDETSRLSGLLSAIEGSDARRRHNTEEERVRLREEQNRLESLQASLQAEISVSRAQLEQDRARLENDRGEWEESKREAILAGTDERERREMERLKLQKLTDQLNVRERSFTKACASRDERMKDMERGLAEERRAMEEEAAGLMEERNEVRRGEGRVALSSKALDMDKAQLQADAGALRELAPRTNEQSEELRQREADLLEARVDGERWRHEAADAAKRGKSAAVEVRESNRL